MTLSPPLSAADVGVQMVRGDDRVGLATIWCPHTQRIYAFGAWYAANGLRSTDPCHPEDRIVRRASDPAPPAEPEWPEWLPEGCWVAWDRSGCPWVYGIKPSQDTGYWTASRGEAMAAWEDFAELLQHPDTPPPPMPGGDWRQSLRQVRHGRQG